MKFNVLLTWCSFLLVSSTLAGCAHAPLQPAGVLSSYAGMKQDNGLFTRSAVKTDRKTLKHARTASIIPIGFTKSAMRKGLSAKQRALVSNAATRGICNELSRSFRIVPPGQPADFTIRGAITDVKMTDPVVAGVSQAGSIATSIAAPLPIPLKRLPLGMCGLALEAEATTPDGRQVAAIVWAQEANPFTSKARLSEAGDAYDLASDFGSEFTRMLNGRKLSLNPDVILASLPQSISDAIPTGADVRFAIDGTAKAPACESYGKGPGILGSIAAGFGAPPEWTDGGAQLQSEPIQKQQPALRNNQSTQTSWAQE